MLRQIVAIVKKDLKQARRDPKFMGPSLIIPFVFLLVYVIMWTSVGGGESFTCGLVVQDNSPEANEFVDILENMVSTTNYTWFSIERYDLTTADQLYQSTELIAYIVIPEGFGDNVASRQNATVVMYINNANDDVVKNYVHRIEAAVLLFNQGAVYPDFDQSDARISIDETFSLTSTPSNLRYMAAVDILLSFMSCALTSQAMLTASEFETNAIHETMNSPTPRLALVLGRTLASIPRSFITLFILAPAMCIGMNVFPTGNILVLIGILLLTALALAPVGELIGMKLRNREQALLASVLFVVVGFIVGGGMAPIGLSPQIIQYVVGIFPTTHALILWARVFFNDTLLGLTTSALVLVATWIVMTIVVFQLMKREVERG
ncbi:MAG: ABC transporter permease [Candidatus Thorarchaeota archaeon]|nr:MAG: ABC transporter permease [Candidatus Thorarchaeota archaeon]